MPTPFEVAKTIQQLGWNVIPVAVGEKGPKIQWREWQKKKQTTADLQELFGDLDACNFWIVAGRVSGLAVIDVDSDEADEWLRGQIPNLDRTWHVITPSGGKHYYFHYPTGSFPSRALRNKGIEIDIKSDGGGVVIPPSKGYRWVIDPWTNPAALKEIPVSFLRKLSSPDGVKATDDTPKKMGLRQLLNAAKTMGEGEGRNDHLTKIAGHYARKFVPDQDEGWGSYSAALVKANKLFPEPLPKEEFGKLRKSVWKAERDKAQQEWTTPSQQAWSLEEQDGRLIAVSNKGLVEFWGDFDVRADAVAYDSERGEMWFRVVLYSDIWPDGYHDLMSSAVLASSQRLMAWLMGRGFGIEWTRKTINHGVMLLKYLQRQKPPEQSVLECHGWHDGVGFVYGGNLITADGITKSDHVVMLPKDWAPFKYGDTDEGEAREVLNEVLTFQDETVASVFGSWWASTFLKGQIIRYTSLFPFLALEAASESGKTRGFFALMIELSGLTVGPGQFTGAALRDRLSAHRNGIVWIDDRTRVDADLDLIRLATSEEYMTKMGEDRTRHERRRLVAPVVLSGESLGAIVTSKAYMDRAILLDAPSPVGRVSLRDSSRSQWDDVQELHYRYNQDLSQLAGTIVRMALKNEDLVEQIPKVRRGVGRNADKWAALLCGATILSRMTEDRTHYDRVKSWLFDGGHKGQRSMEDALTLLVIPRVWKLAGYPTQPWREIGVPNPVWFDRSRSCGWIHLPSLASDWLEYAQRTRTFDPRTQDASALNRQRVSSGLTHSHRFGLPDRTRKALFWHVGREAWGGIARRAGVEHG